SAHPLSLLSFPTRRSSDLASISKPLTAVAAMQLALAQELDLEADVRVLVPEFPEQSWPVTARHLLCHQGGIVHYTNGKVVRVEQIGRAHVELQSRENLVCR